MPVVYRLIHSLLYVSVINNGLILCFSAVKLDEHSTGTQLTYSFPIAYTQIPAIVDLLSAKGSTVNAYLAYRHPHNVTTTQFEITTYKEAQRSWLAIGY